MPSLLQEYAEDASYLGSPDPAAFSGAAGGAACGDLARISLVIGDSPSDGAGDGPSSNPNIDRGGSRVGSVSFDAEGCAATRAACACLCEMIDDVSPLDAARIGPDEIDLALGGLTPAGRHAAVLAADALHRALSGAASSGVRLADPDPDRVLVALSGGVDSAVAALRERERGADVVAVTVKLWADPDTDGTKACCSPEAVLGARAVSHSLGIPHFTLDLEGQFRDRVVGEFVAGYERGQTPNPCVLCNGEVRIAAMVGLADRLGATHLVTGHYARVVDDGNGALLAEGHDGDKDQSYMLAALPPELIARLRFPLAETTKTEVRETAERHSLAVARKPESQDLCFLAGQDKRDFLRRHGGLEDRTGPVVDRAGGILGEHNGHHHFTVGQRRGLGVAAGRPLYVTGTDAATNTVTVGPREEMAAGRVAVFGAVMHRDGAAVDRVRLRYHSPAVSARVSAGAGTSPAAGRHDSLEITLDEPFDGPTPGQAAVMMSGDTVVGHATIAAAPRSPIPGE